MLYKSRNIVLCCSAMLLMANAGNVWAAQASNQAVPVTASPNITSQQVTQVNINSADAATLQKIKGLSKKKAQAIISYRDKNGPFKSFDDLLKVNCRGIHKKWLEKVSKFLIL